MQYMYTCTMYTILYSDCTDVYVRYLYQKLFKIFTVLYCRLTTCTDCVHMYLYSTSVHIQMFVNAAHNMCLLVENVHMYTCITEV